MDKAYIDQHFKLYVGNLSFRVRLPWGGWAGSMTGFEREGRGETGMQALFALLPEGERVLVPCGASAPNECRSAFSYFLPLYACVCSGGFWFAPRLRLPPRRGAHVRSAVAPRGAAQTVEQDIYDVFGRFGQVMDVFLPR